MLKENSSIIPRIFVEFYLLFSGVIFVFFMAILKSYEELVAEKISPDDLQRVR